MGKYTDSHGNTYSINIGYPELQMISNNPDFHFCWMNENGSIQHENSDFYQDETRNNNNKVRVLKEQITVRTAAGETITGRVWHWVDGPCFGTKLMSWFIICTKPYPYNPYNRRKKEAWA